MPSNPRGDRGGLTFRGRHYHEAARYVNLFLAHIHAHATPGTPFSVVVAAGGLDDDALALLR